MAPDDPHLEALTYRVAALEQKWEKRKEKKTERSSRPLKDDQQSTRDGELNRRKIPQRALFDVL